MKRIPLLVLTVTLTGFFFSCRTKPKTSDEKTTEPALVKAPAFNGDSAYAFVAKQVAFGPRVPNSKAHEACGDWMVAQLKRYGFAVTEQRFITPTYDGTRLKARNIIGSYNPSAARRILLGAHWDTRPFADKDTAKLKDKPFDGANDGGSGVAVMLEIARIIQASPDKPKVGIDLIFFDVEDWGEKDGMQPVSATQSFWALGSQYWAKNPHKPGYSAYYGILLDMVGAKGARFPKEGSSMRYASSIVNSVWAMADRLGYGEYFPDDTGGDIMDDHTAVNEVLKIPMIDIVETKIGNNLTFGSYHHTTRDNLATMDRRTLKAVGQTVTQVLYQEE
ncbi:MAG: M28 family peptidase [Cytophagaceae bacterium]|nr:M28 family peptidase [Cytophagaceae bacterium]